MASTVASAAAVKVCLIIVPPHVSGEIRVDGSLGRRRPSPTPLWKNARVVRHVPDNQPDVSLRRGRTAPLAWKICDGGYRRRRGNPSALLPARGGDVLRRRGGGLGRLVVLGRCGRRLVKG